MKTKCRALSFSIMTTLSLTLAVVLFTVYAPARAQTFPEKGKTITFIVAFPAGSGSDTSARLMVPHLEKHIGVPVRIVNKPGAGGQIGATELAKAAPDGYTIGLTNLPNLIQFYLNPERKATFNGASFQLLATNNDEPACLIVRSDSPFRSAKDVMEAIKKTPDTIKAGTSGRDAFDHTFGKVLERHNGGSFRYVHFEGSGKSMVALLGGHTDIMPTSIGLLGSAGKTRQARMIAVADASRNPLFPDVPTFKEQGYDITFSVTRIVSMPAGAPKEVVNALAKALRAAITDPEHSAKAKAAGMELVYRGPKESTAFWQQREQLVKKLMSAK